MDDIKMLHPSIFTLPFSHPPVGLLLFLHRLSLIVSQRPRTPPGSNGVSCMPLLKPRSSGMASTQAVVELRCCEMTSNSMADMVAQVRADAGGELLVGLQRYAFHLPSLTDSLAHINAFRWESRWLHSSLMSGS